jgi:hypothetical protein
MFIRLRKVIGAEILMLIFGDLLTGMWRYETSGERLNILYRTEEIHERPDISCSHPVPFTDNFASVTIISSTALTPVWYATYAQLFEVCKTQTDLPLSCSVFWVVTLKSSITGSRRF